MSVGRAVEILLHLLPGFFIFPLVRPHDVKVETESVVLISCACCVNRSLKKAGLVHVSHDEEHGRCDVACFTLQRNHEIVF